MFIDSVKKGGVQAASYFGGLSGTFIPVSEDAGLADSVYHGALTYDKYEAMTSVCSVGVDMVPVNLGQTDFDKKVANVLGMIGDADAGKI